MVAQGPVDAGPGDPGAALPGAGGRLRLAVDALAGPQAAAVLGRAAEYACKKWMVLPRLPALGRLGKEYDDWWLERTMELMRSLALMIVLIPVLVAGLISLIRPDLYGAENKESWIADTQGSVALVAIFAFIALIPLAAWVKPRFFSCPQRVGGFVSSLTVLAAATMVCANDYSAVFRQRDVDNMFGELTVLLPLGYAAFMGFVTPDWVWIFITIPLLFLLTSVRHPAAAAAFFPYGLVRLTQLIHFTATCIRAVYQQEYSKRTHFIALRSAQAENDRLGCLLRLLLPPKTAALLQAQGPDSRFSEVFPDCALLFIDLCNFERWSRELPPLELVELLNAVFTAIDEVVDAAEPGVFKVETVASVYVISAGAPGEPCAPGVDAAELLCVIALRCRDAVQSFSAQGEPVEVKLGIHVGPIVGGVIGVSLPRYSFLGDTIKCVQLAADRTCIKSPPANCTDLGRGMGGGGGPADGPGVLRGADLPGARLTRRAIPRDGR